MVMIVYPNYGSKSVFRQLRKETAVTGYPYRCSLMISSTRFLPYLTEQVLLVSIKAEDHHSVFKCL